MTGSRITSSTAVPVKWSTVCSSKQEQPAVGNPLLLLSCAPILGQFLFEKAVTLGMEDESSFPMRLLHFRRTFVEKMFAIHSKVEILKRDGRALGTYARHYYDLFQLASRPEILEMLQSAEYLEIKQDYDRISRTHYLGSYFYPDQMSFANSDALFATGKPSAANGEINSREDTTLVRDQIRRICRQRNVS